MSCCVNSTCSDATLELFTGQLQLCLGFLQFFLNHLFFNLKPHGTRQINLILQCQQITRPIQKGLLVR